MVFFQRKKNERSRGLARESKKLYATLQEVRQGLSPMSIPAGQDMGKPLLCKVACAGKEGTLLPPFRYGAFSGKLENKGGFMICVL